MSKTKEAVSDEETLTRVKGLILSRERAKNEVDALFNLAKSARKTAVSTVNRLFVQAPASQNQRPFMQKEAKVFGAGEPDSLRHGQIPYKHRRAEYVEYLKQKSNEKPTGTGKSALVGGAVGGALGLGAGLLHKKPGLAAAGAGLGALVGGALGHGDKKKIEESKKALSSGNIDKHVSKAISKAVTRHEVSTAARTHGPGLAAAVVKAVDSSKQRAHEKDESGARRDHEKWKHEASKPKPAGKCSNCGAPAPTSGSVCTHCGKGSFTKSAAANVIEFFEKKAYLTQAQRLFPELLKVGATETQRQMVPSKKPTGTTASKPIISGDQH